MQDILLADQGKVVPEHKTLDLSQLTPEELEAREHAKDHFTQKLAYL